MRPGSVVLAEGLVWLKLGRRHWVANTEGNRLGQVDRLKRLRTFPDFRILWDPYLHRVIEEPAPAEWESCSSTWGGMACTRHAGHPGLHHRHGSQWGTRSE